VRGQRTRTNARTRKGPRKAIRDNGNQGNENSNARAQEVKKNVAEGIAHIMLRSTTLVTITDRQATPGWATPAVRLHGFA